MKIIRIFLFLVLVSSAAYADVFSDISKKAGADPSGFWTEKHVHFKPTRTTYGAVSYALVTITPKFTVMGEEMSPCLDSDKDYLTVMSEYLFNMYLRMATQSSSSYVKCEGNEDSLLDLGYLGVLDPLFVNRNTLSFMMNNGSLLPWYNSDKLNPLIQQKLTALMKDIGVNFDPSLELNKKCSLLFIKMLDKSMSYYGVVKSLRIKGADYSKVEPLYFYTNSIDGLGAKDNSLKAFSPSMSSALASTAKGQSREFVYYYQGETVDWEDTPGGGMRSTKIKNYTFRPVADECRVLSYVMGAKVLDLVPAISDIYEVWAVPHVLGNNLKVNSGIKLANGKTPSSKWTYHVAIVAVINNEPVVLDGLFYREAISLADWKKLFDPTTRFMIKPFVRSSLIDASFTKPKLGEDVSLKPHPVFN